MVSGAWYSQIMRSLQSSYTEHISLLVSLPLRSLVCPSTVAPLVLVEGEA